MTRNNVIQIKGMSILRSKIPILDHYSGCRTCFGSEKLLIAHPVISMLDVLSSRVMLTPTLYRRSVSQLALELSVNGTLADSGRHPLQELTVPAYVPNDTFLVGGLGTADSTEFQEVQARTDGLSRGLSRKTASSKAAEGCSMLMMTGPNYSGKSVYLKQVALIVYMAHVGCFVPADFATVGLTDKILTRITTRETVSRFQSAFMIDLQQVALAMTLATHRSLVIIDEFGKGTDSSGRISFEEILPFAGDTAFRLRLSTRWCRPSLRGLRAFSGPGN